MTADTKPCVICGATITRTNQGDTDWARRAYCSRTCIWAGRKAKPTAAPVSDTKPCRHCGGTMTRQPQQSVSRWARVYYCSDPCRNAQRGSRRKPHVERCDICRRALPRRKTKPPWCSKPCKTQWQAAHPKQEQPSRARRAALEDADPPVRFRSEVLPDGAPNETWIQRQPGAIAVCCGRCGRRFPRPTIRLAERLRRTHERVCGRGES